MNKLHFTTALIIFATSSASAMTINMVSNTVYNSDTTIMDAALGVTGFTIEDFEDNNLVNGLSIEYTNPDSGPITTLPNLYQDGSGLFSNNSWDSSGSLVNTINNLVWFGNTNPNAPSDNRGAISSRVTFHLNSQVTAFGIGLGNFQADAVDHALLVNGVEIISVIGNLTGFTSGINLRNGYLLIHGEAGESIESVAFQVYETNTKNPLSGFSGDGLVFDHVALAAVPIPAAAWLFGSGLLALIGFGRRKV